jgi:hypothetical protein
MSNSQHVPWEKSQRRTDNERSKVWAKRDGYAWSESDERVIIDEWISPGADGRDEEAVSRQLERTIESCRHRAELVRLRLGLSEPIPRRNRELEYKGIYDDPEDQWWSTDYYT